MHEPNLQLTFRDCEPSEFTERSVREHFAKLCELGVTIEHTHVVLSIPHAHQHKGNHQCVHLQMKVDGRTLVIDHDPKDGRSAEDMYAAIGDSFARARRVLLDHKERSQERHH